MSSAITVAGLVKDFGPRTRALDHLDLRVETGEVHGFLGPNGAGKTTTIRVLLGLLRADDGHVDLLGGDPWRDAVALHRRLAYVEAQGTLEPVLGTAVSRLRWLTAYAVNALVGTTLLILLFAAGTVITGGMVLGDPVSLLLDLVGAALVQLPAIGVLGAAVLALVMLVPRWSAGLSWALVVLTIVLGPMFGPSLGLPTWLLDLSPFTHVPNAPAVPITIGPVLGLVGVGALFAAVGALVMKRRNLALPA